MKISTQRLKAIEKLRAVLPCQLIRIASEYTQHALRIIRNSGLEEKNNASGFRFSMSRRQLASRLGTSAGTTQNWLILATAIGLVTRLSEEEAGGFSEYCYRGIGVQQYSFQKINLKTVRKNWKTWQESEESIRNINPRTMERIFHSDRIYVHPEAFGENMALRVERIKNKREGIQATEEELRLHRNNKKIRLEIRRLENNQRGHWSPSERRIVAPHSLSNSEYQERIERLRNLIGVKKIYDNQVEGIGLSLETVGTKPPKKIEWSGDKIEASGVYVTNLSDEEIKREYWKVRVRAGFKKLKDILASRIRNNQLETIYEFYQSEFGHCELVTRVNLRTEKLLKTCRFLMSS